MNEHQNKRRHFLFHIIIAGVILGAVFFTFVEIERYQPLPKAGIALDGKISETKKTAMNLIIDLAKLFMGWSLVIIGGAAYFLKAGFEKGYKLRKVDLYLAEAVILASTISILYGHLSINFVISSLASEVLKIDDPGLIKNIRLQYIVFLISLLLFGAYIHGTFSSIIKEPLAKRTDSVKQKDELV